MITFIWVLSVMASFSWNSYQKYQGMLESALLEARIAFQKDVLYRKWNAIQGGVYVKVTEKTPPNPYLKIPERDVETISGQHLTLINPSYMTRQIHELQELEKGVKSHITSLKPIRPENRADAWETDALKEFEKGQTEISGLLNIEGQEYLRMMRPLITEKTCLKCHEVLGYQEGDIRGGISVAIPMTLLTANFKKQNASLALGHGGLLLLGCLGIWFAGQREKQRIRERELSELELGKSRMHAEAIIQMALDAVVEMDESGLITSWNPQAEIIFGWKASEVKGKQMSDILIRPQHLQAHAKGLLKFQQTGEHPILNKALELVALHRDGREIPVELYITPIKKHDYHVFSAFLRDITQRKQAEEKLRKSEHEYRTLANNIPGMIYRGNPDWSTKIVSNSKLLSGYSIEEFNSGEVGWLDIMHPDDRERVFEEGTNLSDKPWDIIQTYRIISKDGSVHWVEDRKTSFFTKGQFSGVDGVVFDITERKLMEEALKTSQQKLLFHIEQTFLAVHEYDLNYRVVEWNPASERIFGYTKKEALGRHVGELIVPESAKEHVHNLWKRLIKQKGGEYGINQNITKRGDLIVCEWYNTPLVDRNGVVVGIASFAQDITERIRAEEDLKKAHQELKNRVKERTRLVLAIEQSNDSIVITDFEGNIEYVNPAFERNTGYSQPEVLGENPRIQKSGKHDDAFYREIWETITSGKNWTGNIINKRKDGTFIEESAAIFPVVTSDGEIQNFVGVKRDMTEQLNMEKQLRQVQKLDAIGTLASGIAHDFNNILGAIFAYTQLSKKKLSDFPEHHLVSGYLDNIFSAGSRAKELIDQILTFSRKGDYVPMNVDLSPLVKESIKFLRATIPATISIMLDIDADLRNIHGDPTQIQQVLMNLCTNASHAMEDKGGTLKIDLSNFQIMNKEPNTGNLEPGDYLLLSISDTGIGMSNEIKQRIFEPFYTTKEKGKGTGLGLSAVHGIVIRHGGIIKVYSEEGLGTRFNIYLPASTEATTKTKEDVSSELPRGSESILLVDDEADIRSAYKDMLVLQGYTVQAVASSQDALNRFNESPDDYDLIITDYTMPEINGIELSREIHKKKLTIPIILISGLEKLIRDEEIESAGIVARFSKPVEFETLIRGVREVLDDKF